MDCRAFWAFRQSNLGLFMHHCALYSSAKLVGCFALLQNSFLFQRDNSVYSCGVSLVGETSNRSVSVRYAKNEHSVMKTTAA